MYCLNFPTEYIVAHPKELLSCIFRAQLKRRDKNFVVMCLPEFRSPGFGTVLCPLTRLPGVLHIG